MQITVTQILGVLIILFQAGIAIAQYLLNQKVSAALREIRTMRPTIRT